MLSIHLDLPHWISQHCLFLRWTPNKNTLIWTSGLKKSHLSTPQPQRDAARTSPTTGHGSPRGDHGEPSRAAHPEVPPGAARRGAGPRGLAQPGPVLAGATGWVCAVSVAQAPHGGSSGEQGMGLGWGPTAGWLLTATTGEPQDDNGAAIAVVLPWGSTPLPAVGTLCRDGARQSRQQNPLAGLDAAGSQAPALACPERDRRLCHAVPHRPCTVPTLS